MDMRIKPNADIRQQIRDSGIYFYEIAEALGIHETTFYRKLRKELDEREKQSILTKVKELSI
ncbi:hypothetical protein OK414_29440 [Priestia sp. JV24]|uniref:hypothetical protein n=1 Tax=Priestia TaxID=2800373 RepID=UPI0021D69424|nr:MULTISPECIES: hypothetical protein [Priestia]MCU7712994.1 hypothetical protein [Priestia megaterium]MCW1049179.1 hypothetical protein [Priestia sp. JV24]